MCSVAMGGYRGKPAQHRAPAQPAGDRQAARRRERQLSRPRGPGDSAPLGTLPVRSAL